MKVLLLCGGAANQRALACKLDASIGLTGIGVIEFQSMRKLPFISKMTMKLVALPLGNAWRSMLRSYTESYPEFPRVPLSVHESVNSESVATLVRDMRPDLVLVSGTDLLRLPLIASIGESGRVVNLHTGISPYIKGGPNCTNWALSIGRPDLIGNTIMWLDPGIDSGNIIASERTPLTGRESLSALHMKVMEHAHDLYVRAAQRIAAGSPVASVKQRDLGKGHLFLTRDWNPISALRAQTFFVRKYNSNTIRRRGAEKLVPLSGIGSGDS